MKSLIHEGAFAYTMCCATREMEGRRVKFFAFTSALLAKTGAELTLAAYDGAGALRQLWSAKGAQIAAVRESGRISDVYGVEGNCLAHYDREGTLVTLFDATVRRSKGLATCRADGTISSLLDEKGKPLADCDENGRLIAIRHAESDILTEADVEYADRLTLAETRLSLAEQMRDLAGERLLFAERAYAAAREDHEAGRELAVVSLADSNVSGLADSELSLTGYDVHFEGETLTVRAYADLLLQRAFAALLDTVSDGADTWELPDNFAATDTDRRVSTEIPVPKTEQGILRGVYYCGDNNFELCLGGVTAEEYRNYVSDLTAKGFAVYAENKIGNCLFGTYTHADALTGETVVFTMHYPGLNRTQIVYGPRGYLPDTAPVEMPKDPVTPVFIQPGRIRPYLGPTCAPGMSYVIQLADGSFIVIDGGPADAVVTPKVKKKGEWITLPEERSREEEKLYELLCQRTPEGKKPRIAYWFMTHPHGDHTELANSFLKNYEGRVTVERIALNMPHFESCPCLYSPMGEKNCVTPFRERATELYGAETFVLHAGQRLLLPGCELEVLYTQEDYFPAAFASANHMSCAFVLKFAHRTVTILGDCEKQLCKAMADAYGPALKCDAVQLTHHGSNGGDVDLYRYMDADICFWAIDNWRFETRMEMTGKADGYLYNRYVRDDKIKKRTHYPNDTTVILEV